MSKLRQPLIDCCLGHERRSLSMPSLHLIELQLLSHDFVIIDLLLILSGDCLEVNIVYHKIATEFERLPRGLHEHVSLLYDLRKKREISDPDLNDLH